MDQDARALRAQRRGGMGPPRLLSFVIVAASAALTVRVAGLADDLQTLAASTMPVAEAQAAAPDVVPVETAASHASAKAPSDSHAADNAKDNSHAAARSGGHGDDPARGSASGEGSDREDRSDSLSHAEIQVLQQLASRRSQLEARENELADRGALLEAAEARIDDKIAELKDLRNTLEGLIRAYEDQEDAKVRSLVKIYETMKPREAARIFAELELETLLMVADRMKERRLSAIMANLDPAKAKEVTVELARLRQLPAETFGNAPAAE